MNWSKCRSEVLVTSKAAERVRVLSKKFRLPTVADEVERRFVEAGFPEALETLAEVFEAEDGSRGERRVERLRKQSRLPMNKTFSTLDLKRLPSSLRHKIRELAGGQFATEAHNILAFGLPGTGKTHAVSAIGHALVEAGRTVLFTPAYKLVQELLSAKRDLQLPRMLKKLDKFEVLILDDIGYVQQSPEEVEVLFTLLAERYERRSLVITSNLVFSEWDQIFKNPMTTAAAIDRVVHHSSILEFDVESFRAEQAKLRKKKGKSNDN